MARRFRYGGGRQGPPRRVAYRMVSGRKFYEKMPRKFPYGVLTYAQYNYWTIGYCENDASS